MDSAVAAQSTAPKTTTRRVLWSLCILLMVATTAVCATSWWVFDNVHKTVATVQSTTAPAIREVLDARSALAKADSTAVDSFRSGEAKLRGPVQYQNQLTLASQRLVQVAEHNAAGQGSQRVQLLQALLESYSELVIQAHAHVGTAVGNADLWSASHLLHAGDSPILQELDNLLEDHTRALDRQIAATSMTTQNIVTWVMQIALLWVLLALLIAAQIFLRRRFRRAWNPWLILATVAWLGLSVMTYLVVLDQYQLEESRKALTDTLQLWEEQTSAVDARGQQELRELMRNECGQDNAGCGPTVERFISSPQPVGDTTRGVPDELLAKRFEQFDNGIDKAAQDASLEFLIPVQAGLIFFVLIPSAFWPRIEEYRYRSK
jgi:hypothetical protein